MDPTVEIALLKEEVSRLKLVIENMAEAIKLLHERDDKAQEFIARVESLLDKK